MDKDGSREGIIKCMKESIEMVITNPQKLSPGQYGSLFCHRSTVMPQKILPEPVNEISFGKKDLADIIK